MKETKSEDQEDFGNFEEVKPEVKPDIKPESTAIDLKLSQQVLKSDEKLQIEDNYIPNQESKKSSDSWEDVK